MKTSDLELTPALEAELVRRILTAFPPDESREFRSLIARRRQGTLTPAQKAKAKAAAKKAGRPYPNLVDNMRASKGK